MDILCKNGSQVAAWDDKKNSFWHLGILCVLVALLSGCGKNETTGSVMGTATGGIIGAAVSKDKGTGALIGGLIGNVLGGSIGRSADDDERAEDQEREARIHARQLAYRDQENYRLKQQMTKWCVDCNKKSTIYGANSCTTCGGNLVHEKFCTRCTTLFSPEEGFRYCPHCKVKVLLSSR